MLNNNQVVHTKDVAEAIKSLAGLFVKPEQLKQVEVIDRAEKKHYVAPGLISRIINLHMYEPDRDGSMVYYVNGESFKLDLETQQLAKQLGMTQQS